MLSVVLYLSIMTNRACICYNKRTFESRLVKQLKVNLVVIFQQTKETDNLF